MNAHIRVTTMAVAAATLLAACGSSTEDGPGALTIYSGRSESLVGPLIERFETASGLQVDVRYGDTAELASQIVEEGANSPADVFFAQDAGALGALERAGRLAMLPEAISARVPARYRSRANAWTGASGRVRVIAFNPTLVEEADVPDSILALTEARWRGKVGWAPTNGSFQIFVTALRTLRGERAAQAWLWDMKANGARVFPNNDAIVEAIAQGEIPLGLVNHYYPFEIREQIPDANVRDHFLADGDPGGLVNVAGAGVLSSSGNKGDAERFVSFLLSDDSQRYFVEETFEYPLVPGIEQNPALPSLEELEPPEIDLTALADLEGTLALLGEVGLL